MTKTVIVDIDGTICDISDRVKNNLDISPKNWKGFKSNYHTDKPIEPILELIKNLDFFYNIVFCTGRSENEREETKNFLSQYYSDEDNIKIIMRSEGDRRQDYIIKPENLKKAGYNTNNVAFILEDRDSVVKMWRKLGFTCLQVANGNF